MSKTYQFQLGNYTVRVLNASTLPTPRLRVRYNSTESSAKDVAETAIRHGRFAIRASHGGSVANAYHYPAETEGVVAAAAVLDNRVDVVVWASRLPAKKVTLSGVARHTVGEDIAPMFDERYGKRERNIALLNAQQYFFSTLSDAYSDGLFDKLDD